MEIEAYNLVDGVRKDLTDGTIGTVHLWVWLSVVGIDAVLNNSLGHIKRGSRPDLPSLCCGPFFDIPKYIGQKRIFELVDGMCGGRDQPL